MPDHPGVNETLTELTGRKVLVTGGAGFLGSHVRAALAARSRCQVIAPTRAECDLLRQDQVDAMLARERPDVVIHLAAEVGGIEANRAQPGRFFYANLLMGALLMEASRLHGVAKFVAVGTICAYPKHTPVPFREASLWDGYPEETNAPYGLAKKMLLVQAQAYRAQYGFRAIYLLPVNLYGPGDDFDLQRSHVIPAMIRKCVEARERGDPEIVLWGDGSPTREFLYVGDCAEAICLATARYDDLEPVNLGSGVEIPIRELAGRIAHATGYAGRIRWDTTKPNGQPRRCLDVSRARERFGFVARTGFDAGLALTIDWYLAHRDGSHR